MENVILLNGDFTILGFIGWKKAIKLIVKKRVEVISYSERIIHNFENTIRMAIPAVLRLLKVVRKLFGVRVPLSKRNVLIRDGHKCAYCGKVNKKGMTIDHVLPKSKGGKTSFDNLVTACVHCNNKKDNKTCKEAGMYPKFKPFTPTINQFLQIQLEGNGIVKTLKNLGIL